MKKVVLKIDKITIHPNDKRRVYHELEGSFDGYYFYAKTDNSHKIGYANYGIKNGSVYMLDVWKGGHPVGRDSVQGKSIHVSKDFIAGFHNKWDFRPKTIANRNLVYKLVSELDKIADRKRLIPKARIKKHLRKS